MIGWALAYGALRTYWALGHRPWFPPVGPDLLAFSGWGVVVLCAASAAAAVAVRLLVGPLGLLPGDDRPPPPRITGVSAVAAWTAVAITWALSAALTSAACLLLLDVVGLLFVGTGTSFDAGALLSRSSCMAGAVLVGTTALAAGRRLRAACPDCGRPPRAAPAGASGARAGSTRAGSTGAVGSAGAVGAVRAPWWAFAAGYAAVLGCVIRFGAQAMVGFGPKAAPASGSAGRVAGLAFLAAAALAGTLLPLAQVHRFGRVWPRWVLGLAGHRVPRWLVLGPGLAVSVGMTAYFGTGLVQLLTQPATAAQADPYPPWFMGVAMSAYLVWGVGLGVAALAYRLLTRPRCAWCGTPAEQTRIPSVRRDPVGTAG
ncbi:hypothetical protein SAMN04489717_5443 [Actinopolymorpha singaporensis]|uniref:Uncharacterized protein n=1 Tax=Actinopolymorpha singaporensis TaxID=117157 RepID=A0A1H1YE77_9ACTN|nr:hypothetical protein SAMN04489717_5443 [Actinopolymorpha singaporensis]